MATVIRYVNPASSGGDGTTNATSGAQAAYASLNAWEAAEQTNLVSDGDIHEVRCEGTGDTGAGVSINGWTTGASNYIYIVAESANRHDGTWSTGKYYLEGASSATGRLNILEDYVRVEGLQIRNTSGGAGSTSSSRVTGTGGTTDIRFNDCIIRDARYTVRVESGSDYYHWNNIVYGGSVGAVVVTGGGVNGKFYSDTLIGVTYGLYRTAGTVTAKNCYAKGTTAYNGTITKTTCASSDTTGSAGLQSIAYSTSQFTNVTAGSEDLSLVSGSALIDVGTDTSGDAAPLDFTDDIIGTARGGTWDVGAFEFVGAAGIAVLRRRREGY